MPGYEATSWVGIVAPAGTPQPVVDAISRVFAQAMEKPEIVKRLAELGATAATSSPAEFKKFITADRAKWQSLAKEANIVAR